PLGRRRRRRGRLKNTLKAEVERHTHDTASNPQKRLIADLHAHYAMHLVPQGPGGVERAATARGRGQLRDRLRALVLGILSRFANYRSFESGPRVTLSSLRAGGVSVVLSVLYSPFDEMDLERPYGAKPENGYLDT